MRNALATDKSLSRIARRAIRRVPASPKPPFGARPQTERQGFRRGRIG
jgi:hypothetical protein